MITSAKLRGFDICGERSKSGDWESVAVNIEDLVNESGELYVDEAEGIPSLRECTDALECAWEDDQ